MSAAKAQVCRTWRDIAYVRSVWEDVEVTRLWPKSLCDIYLSRGIHRIQVGTAPVPDRKLLRNMNDFISHRLRAQVRTANDLAINLKVEGVYYMSKIDRSLYRLLQMTSKSLRLLTLDSIRLNIVNTILAECPNIVELSLRSVTDCSDLMESGRDAFWIVLRGLRQLRCLRMYGIGSHSEMPGFDFFRCTGNDRSANYWSGDGFHRDPSVLMPSMTGLHLIWISELTDSSLKFICQSMPNLVELDLTVMGHCEELNLETMKRIAAMKHLRQLTLPTYHRHTYTLAHDDFMPEDISSIGPSDHALNSLASFGLLGQLHQLSVAGISDHSMNLISKWAHKSINSLKIKESFITDVGIHQLVTSCCQLTTLEIHHCLRVTDEGLVDIARHLNRLENVFIYGKDYRRLVVGDGFKSVLDLPRLKIVGVSFGVKCPNCPFACKFTNEQFRVSSFDCETMIRLFDDHFATLLAKSPTE